METQGRRQFVKTASAAIATAAFPILGANDSIRVGIVGLGGRGRDHIEYYTKLKSTCRIAAICDVNQAARERAQAQIRKLSNMDVTQYVDMRDMFASKDVDAVSLPLPNHWHALATIWACQAGKDVYVEKPASHNVFESHQMVAAARKYNRMVQVGMQSRSVTHKMHAVKLLADGVVGELYHARGLCFRRRFSIGHTPDAPVPPGLDWNRFLGPAQYKPYSQNKFAYTWHWFWDTGNGDFGNQGIHELDICLWGLARTGWPKDVSGTGGKFVWKDDQETPNTLQTCFNFGDAEVTFDVRNLPTPLEGLLPMKGPNFTGNIFFGEQGFLVVDPDGFQVYKSTAGNVDASKTHGAGVARFEKYEKTMDEKATENDDDATVPHMHNFLDAIRARDHKLLHADIEIGARSASFVHMGNISYRTGRSLRVAQATGRFLEADDANALLTRDYREPFVVPREV
ncbi:MAG TPA: Gfo/Idh/MocA family oxidoreductase [Bryobacteraceae bacterium]|jgi:predicted dehydrogenase|nr:Gfo/Idh/MocA family oxidoreductase [Bryobacteraceae bacterium]